MALYEITFLTKEEADPGVRGAIEAAGGAITGESSLGRRRLVYPIRKETQAVYTTYVFDAPPASLGAIEPKLRQSSELLRYLLVAKPAPKATKEVSKAVREAIAAAEKLEDTAAEPTLEVPIVSPEPLEEPAAEITEAPAAKPTRKRAAAKAALPEPDAAAVTEEDRLKALEDKLDEILKD